MYYFKHQFTFFNVSSIVTLKDLFTLGACGYWHNMVKYYTNSRIKSNFSKKPNNIHNFSEEFSSYLKGIVLSRNNCRIKVSVGSAIKHEFVPTSNHKNSS